MLCRLTFTGEAEAREAWHINALAGFLNVRLAIT